MSAALLLAAAALGVWDRWGTFAGDGRCYAISAPVRAGGRERAFASVAAGFGRDRRAALFVRWSAGRSALSANRTAAWSPDAATDRAIVAAMRGARSMSVSAVSARGRAFADAYALTGAVTAVDAAVLASAAR